MYLSILKNWIESISGAEINNEKTRHVCI